MLGLLGDIGIPSLLDSKLEDFLRWCSERFLLVFYIPGNHEYYSEMGYVMDAVHEWLRSICSQFPNVHMLDNRTYEIEDVMFIGSTLWSNVPVDKEAAVVEGISDYHVIYSYPGVRITPRELSAKFWENLAFIASKVEECKERGHLAVVLTHHAPSFIKTSDPSYKDSDKSFAFATTINYQHDPHAIRLWCCGHTHFNFRHKEEGYELVSNQMGYRKPKPRFKRDLTISL